MGGSAAGLWAMGLVGRGARRGRERGGRATRWDRTIWGTGNNVGRGGGPTGGSEATGGESNFRWVKGGGRATRKIGLAHSSDIRIGPPTLLWSETTTASCPPPKHAHGWDNGAIRSPRVTMPGRGNWTNDGGASYPCEGQCCSKIRNSGTSALIDDSRCVPFQIDSLGTRVAR